jgi:LysR family transcriptional regulator, glycine cleavage system transcriptional activator
MRRLPYLNGVKTFEAAARCGSFAAAAKELNVSPAAVSRMVRLLEDRMGVDLFQRGANKLVPTESGRKFQAGLGPILDALALLADQVRAPASRVLTIGVGPTFAVRWLIPRLACFSVVAPDVEVRMTTGGAAAPFADDWTCGIKLGNGKWPGLAAERLFEANLIPVCSPALARKLRRPRDLDPKSLLRVAHAKEDWLLWLKKARAGGVTARGPMFEFYMQALQAAADGVGVALGIRPYIDDDIAAGRLVTPFDLSVPKGGEWYLIYDPRRRDDYALKAFRAWVLSEA